MKIAKAVSFLAVLLVSMQATDWAQAAGACGGGGGVRPAPQGNCGGGGGSPAVVLPPVKVTVARVVDCEGKIDYLTCKTAAEVTKRREELKNKYETALVWWKNVDESFAKQGLKNERVAPVEPIVDVIQADILKKEAAGAIQKTKDWAVYEIATTPRTKRVLSYAGSDGFAKALADAEFARVYNQWVKGGKKDGEEPKAPTVSKVGDSANKEQAQKLLSARPTGCSTK
ncbi:MAG: hypothetical protein WCR06_00190 [bacterium]